MNELGFSAYGQDNQQFGQQQQYGQQPMQQPMQQHAPSPQMNVGVDPQQQHQQMGFNAGNMGNMANDYLNNAATSQMGNLAMGYGQNLLNTHGKQGMEAMQRFGLGSDALRQYFHVDGSYVLARLKVMAFPFSKKKDWRRRSHDMQQQQQAQQYGQEQPNMEKPMLMMSPREDENAPDLYIPTMAFITYVLTAGFTMGVDSAFSPEMLGRTSSFGLVLWLLEVFAIKFGIYLLHNVQIAMWDATAYAGYKFVGAVVALLTYLTFGTMAYYVVLLYTGAAVGYMIFKSYWEIMFPGGFVSEGKDTDSKRLVLMVVGALQVFLTWFLVAV